MILDELRKDIVVVKRLEIDIEEKEMDIFVLENFELGYEHFTHRGTFNLESILEDLLDTDCHDLDSERRLELVQLVENVILLFNNNEVDEVSFEC